MTILTKLVIEFAESAPDVAEIYRGWHKWNLDRAELIRATLPELQERLRKLNSDCREIKTVKVIGKRPSQALNNMRIFNAPRPLYGTKTWQGDFVSGRFYAGVDINDPDAERWIKENESLHAIELEFITEEQAIREQMAFYKSKSPKLVSRINLDDPEHYEMVLDAWKHRQQ